MYITLIYKQRWDFPYLGASLLGYHYLDNQPSPNRIRTSYKSWFVFDLTVPLTAFCLELGWSFELFDISVTFPRA